MTAVSSKLRLGFWIDELRSHLPRRFRPVPFNTREDYLSHVKRRSAQYEHRRRVLNELVDTTSPIVTTGYCICCRRIRDFQTDPVRWKANPEDMPNWREGLVCPDCHLSSRMRASVHLLRSAVRNKRDSRVYLTEQTTHLYQHVRIIYHWSVGSEYLHDGTRSGATNSEGIRHEDLTALSFPDRSFDAVVSLEVIEHVPDFRRAFAECARVLVPGGRLILTVPFHRGPSHLERARLMGDGSVEHIHPPEYHGNPLDPEQGSLCFHHFGWDILDYLKQAGFRRASTYSTWSRELGYLSGDCDMLQFIASR
jgi:SAM-dependent methyltransferase